MDTPRIRAVCGRLRRRALCVGAAAGAGLALPLAAALVLGGMIAARLFLWPLPLLEVAVGTAAVALAASLAVAWWRRPDELGAALAADTRLGLGERLSSALRAAGDPSPMAPAVVADATAYADRVRAGAVYPWRAPRGWRALVVLVALLSGALFLPLDDALGLRKAQAEKQAEREAVNVAVQTLEKKAREIKRFTRSEKPEKADALEHMLEQVANELKQNVPDRREAMVKLAALAEKLREERAKRGEGADKMSESLGGLTGLRMAAEVKRALEKGDAGAAQEAMSRLMTQVKNGAFNADQTKQLGRELKKLALQLPADAPLKKSMEALGEALEKRAEKAQQEKDGQGKEGEGKDGQGKEGEGKEGEGKTGEPGEGEEMDEATAAALAQMARDLEAMGELQQEMQALDEALDATQQSRYGMLPTTFRLCDLCRRGIPHESQGGT